MRPIPFDIFKPSPDELLRRVSQHVDDAMLEEIAAADYGDDLTEHLAHLRRTRDDGSFAIPMRWCPREVLELIRWSQPEDPEWGPGGFGERGHWMRAFACTALLRAGGDDGNEELREGWNSTLIQLIESLNVLSLGFAEAAAGLFAWLINAFAGDPEAEELAFFGVGLLWFGLHFKQPMPDEAVIALSEWIIARERRDRSIRRPVSDRWLLGTTLYDQRHAGWRRLGDAFLELALASRSATVRDLVQFIGVKLAQSDRAT